MSVAFAAMSYARHVHRDQCRKYTNAPYADHLAEVAGIVATVATTWHSFAPQIIATAWLHDCMEDQGVAAGDLARLFGSDIVEGVVWLSDMEPGNRAERKAASRERLACAPAWVQAIKCADLISNTSSIVQHDPKFAVTYLEEKRLLLEVLTKADPFLHKLAADLANQKVPS